MSTTQQFMPVHRMLEWVCEGVVIPKSRIYLRGVWVDTMILLGGPVELHRLFPICVWKQLFVMRRISLTLVIALRRHKAFLISSDDLRFWVLFGDLAQKFFNLLALDRSSFARPIYYNRMVPLAIF